MKSIMEEASSVAKAIERGWLKAGKPTEFSVKVHEQPQKNFFGITVQNAKIAIIFEESRISSKQEPKRPPRARKPLKPRPESRKTRPEETEEEMTWTSEMISFATKWLKTTLNALEKKDIAFSAQADGNQLFITFERPIMADAEQNKRVVRPLSQLLVQTLRNHLKLPLRGYKVIMKVAR